MKVRFGTVLLFVLFGSVGFASSNDFGNSAKSEALTPAQLREQFEVFGEVFLLSPDGKRVLSQYRETRTWRFPPDKGNILSHWQTMIDNEVIAAIKHEWSINAKGEFQVRIEQYDGFKGHMPFSPKVDLGKKIREEVLTITNFAPVVWEIGETKGQRVAIRMTPKLKAMDEFINPGQMPITIRNGVISDSKGRVWASEANVDSRYVSIKTHVGQLVISYSPFQGAKEIGYTEGNEIRLNPGKIEIAIRSARPLFTTEKRAKIYGYVDLEKKSEHYGSVYTGAGDEEEEFLKHLK